MIPKSDFHYLHLFESDHIGHKFGKDSDALNEKLAEYDRYIEKLSKISDNLILFSDHGMVDVTGEINIWKSVESAGYKYGKDYLMFLDSTLARFWFFNKKAKGDIISCLPKGGHVLSQKEKHEARIPGGFGEEFYLADAGKLIVPNFYQESACRTMHGYSPATEEQKGFYYVPGEQKEQEINITELLGLTLNLFKGT